LATIISRPSPTLAVADAGLKACTEDHGNPAVRDVDGASVLFLSDEHASLVVPAESDLAVGDRIMLVPSHIDPTINLHDVFYVIEGGRLAEKWPIEGRGYVDQRRA
jgi:D-serine deaminase-like pyridoxal phosphate-dependent protein